MLIFDLCWNFRGPFPSPTFPHRWPPWPCLRLRIGYRPYPGPIKSPQVSYLSVDQLRGTAAIKFNRQLLTSDNTCVSVSAVNTTPRHATQRHATPRHTTPNHALRRRLIYT